MRWGEDSLERQDDLLGADGLKRWDGFDGVDQDVAFHPMVGVSAFPGGLLSGGW